ncbi:MAG: multicopper oxidase domain-containing protein [Bacteroidota bacterium]
MKNFTLKMLTPLLAFLLLGVTAYAQSFLNKLPIPEVIDRDTVLLRVDTALHDFNPVGGPDDPLNGVLTYAFNENREGQTKKNTILGPTISWQFGHVVHTEVFNNLPKLDNQDTTATTVHWHGAHVPVYTDGGPHQIIDQGDTWKIDFEIKDKSATMWYHPHFLDQTVQQVQYGLSGMIYVQDPVGGDGDDAILNRIHNLIPTDYGVNDFPIILQTKGFIRKNSDNKVDSLDANGKVMLNPKSTYHDNFINTVNGVVHPYLEVPADIIRLRVLNGDGKFIFDLGLGNRNENGDLQITQPFEFIATDAGYTDSSYTMEKVLVAPGERVEWLVDLRNYAVGDTLYLINFANSLRTGLIGGKFPKVNSSKGGGNPNNFVRDTAFLKLIVNSIPDSVSTLTFPQALHPLESVPFTFNTKRRVKILGPDQIADTSATGHYNIDNIKMNMMVVNDTVLLDSTEIWTIINRTNTAHPWHIHDIHFLVKEIIDIEGNIYTPESDTLQHIFRGPVDNVLIESGWQLSYVAKFEDFGTQIAPDSTYMYHCHILPHEDKGMMHQFAVWDQANAEMVTSLEEQLLEASDESFVYPNPATDQLFLEGKSAKVSHLRFFDLQGRLLKERPLPPFDGVVPIKLDYLPKGMVFVVWQRPDKRLVKKIVLE